MADEKEITVELPEKVTKALDEVERLSAEQKKLADTLAKLANPEAETPTATLTTEIDSAQKEYQRIESELTEARKQLRTELEVRTKELEASKAEVVKLNKQRRGERFIKMCAPLVHLPGTQADDFAGRMDAIEKAIGAKEFEKLYQLFVSWNTVIEKNNVLMKEIGVEGGSAFMTGPEAQLDALAKEKAAADKITYHQAYAKVLAEHPEIYRKYRAEQARGGN